MEEHAPGVVGGGDLERRVLDLLGADHRDPERLLGNDALAAGIIALGACALIIAWPGDAFHHAVETLIGQLIR